MRGLWVGGPCYARCARRAGCLMHGLWGGGPCYVRCARRAGCSLFAHCLAPRAAWSVSRFCRKSCCCFDVLGAAEEVGGRKGLSGGG